MCATLFFVAPEFTVQSSPSYRSLEVVLPSARALRAQQVELTQRRAETLRAISHELQAAMALGHDSCILHFSEGWRTRALEQAGYQVSRAPAHYGEERFLVYFGDRDASERSALLQSHERPDGPSAAEHDRYIPASPPSPSVYTRSVYNHSPPLIVPPLAPEPVRPPFARAQTQPGASSQRTPRPDRSVGFASDVAAGAYVPSPGQRF